jgi:pimeloyl-ACP methyl ester carboxylesterase
MAYQSYMHRTLAVDRRGRGASGDSEAYAIEREYEDVAAVVDSIGESANLLGHSFGAACALGSHCSPGELRDAKAVAAALPDSRILILPGQQHSAMYTAPELFVREVVNLLVE